MHSNTVSRFKSTTMEKCVTRRERIEEVKDSLYEDPAILKASATCSDPDEVVSSSTARWCLC